jgi:hypothetical protein
MTDSAPQPPQQSFREKARALFFPIAATLAAFAMNIALQKGWVDRVPDGLVGLLFIIAALLWIYWAWTHEGVRKRHYLVYTYPVMSLITLIVTGACIGGILGAFAWWTTHRQEHAQTSPAQPPITEVTPQPSPSVVPHPMLTTTTVESPRTIPQPFPSSRKPSGKRSKAAERQRRREEALRDLDYKKTQK